MLREHLDEWLNAASEMWTEERSRKIANQLYYKALAEHLVKGRADKTLVKIGRRIRRLEGLMFADWWPDVKAETDLEMAKHIREFGADAKTELKRFVPCK